MERTDLSKKEKLYTTENLQQIIKLHRDKSEQILNAIQQSSDQYVDNCLDHKGEEHNVAYSFARKISSLVEESLGSFRKASCVAGCSFCCHINVDVTEHEATLAFYAAENLEVDIDIDLLKRQADTKEWSDLPFADRHCVFLKDNLCSIYEYRPTACRKHVVSGNPNDCDTSNKEAGQIEKIVNFEAEALVTGILNTVKSGRMAEELLKQIEKHKKG